jgi:hypothetical protein
MPGIDSITKLFDLFISGVNNTTTALGEDSAVGKLGAYGDLLPAILNVVGSVKNLPTELRDLDPGEVGTLITHVAQKIDLPGDRAEAIVRKGAEVANQVLQTVAVGTKELGVIIKKQQDAVKA